MAHSLPPDDPIDGLAFSTPDPPDLLLRLRRISPFHGATVLNSAELYTGGSCHGCGLPLGPRTTAALRIRFDLPEAGRMDGGSAGPRDPHLLGPSIPYFSERFLSLLSPEELRRCTWRPIEVASRGTPQPMFELLGSEHHLPLVALLNGSPDRDPCAICNQPPSPSYVNTEGLPVWLNPTGAATWNGQPACYVNATLVASPFPEASSCGLWGSDVNLVFTPLRWQQLRRSLGHTGLSRPEHIGVVPASLTVGAHGAA